MEEKKRKGREKLDGRHIGRRRMRRESMWIDFHREQREIKSKNGKLDISKREEGLFGDKKEGNARKRKIRSHWVKKK